MARSVIFPFITVISLLLGCSSNLPPPDVTPEPQITSTSPKRQNTPAPTAAATDTPEPATPQPTAAGPSPKLSSRLAQLADPAIHTLPLDEQAHLLSLPASGSGSLTRNDAGDLLVYIRMAEISEENVAALKETGADVTHVAEPFRTVTAYVAPTELSALANLTIVDNIQEVLKPD